MKRKIFLIIGIVIFIILAVGSVSGANAVNKEEVDTETIRRPYDVSDVEISSDGFATYVTGVLTNNIGAKGYVQILIPCYDKDGAKVGDAMDNINNIEEKGKWRFKAMLIEKADKCDIGNIQITGF